MGWFSNRSSSGNTASDVELPSSPHRYAVVDVETTGLYPNSCRVLSVAALALDERGHPERQVVTLVDPGCDPGPVHIHGLTRQRLAGSPRYADILPQLHDLLAGRVLVAHNASFDFGFIAAEAVRAGTSLPTRQRLCTLALSRRLGLPVTNHKLGTLAAHWGIPQQRAHDAHDDALVTARILAHSAQLAGRLGLPLPLVDCHGHHGQKPYPARVVKTPCPWRSPGRLEPGCPLVQGMKVVVTGATRLPREELCARLTNAGLDVLSSVSRLTAVLLSNEPRAASAKAQRARSEGTLVIDETMLLRLLADVRPGVLKDAPAARAAARTSPTLPAQRTAPPAGPLAGRRVLVLGGTHAEAAEVRAAVVSAGGGAAVNLSANVTDLFLLDGGDTDSRLPRAVAAGVRAHHGPVALGIPLPTTAAARPTAAPAADPDGATGDPSVAAALAAASGAAPPVVLARGAVIDLPLADARWTVNAAWRAGALADGCELDVVAFLLDDSERVSSDDEFVFWNAPLSEDGAVALSIDGDSEQAITIDLDLLPDHVTRVAVAGALTGATTFGELGAVTLSVDGQHDTVAVATLDAGTTETVLVLAEIYRRGDRWRVRAVGQGYDDGLAALATRFGVTVEN